MFKFKKEFFPLNKISTQEERKSNLSEMLKEATKIKSKDGYDNSIVFLENIIKDYKYNEEEIIRIIKRIIEYKIKSSSIDESLNYLDTFLRDKDIHNKSYIDLHCIYSKLLSQKDKSLGIVYLTKLLDNNFTDYSFIKFYNELATEYKKNNNFVYALNTYNALLKKLNIEESFQFQRHYCDITFEISELYYESCQNEWEKEFIKFRILNFVYYTITDIDLNIMSDFFYRKEICYNGEWGKDEKLEMVLHQIGKKDKIKEIYKIIFDFTFFELPIIMGLPIECLNKVGYEAYRNSPSFTKEYMKLKYIIDSDGRAMFDEDGLALLRPFTKFQEIEDCIQRVAYEIMNK